MARIAIAGFQHETNSFAQGKAGMAEFQMTDSWPGLVAGETLLSETDGLNLPIAGFAAVARTAGHDLHPVLWCAAEPSGPVTDDAFETISARILDGIAGADAVYLDLHGAMITDSHDDGEGELLARLRARHPDLPLVISLDLHANLSPQMVEMADHVCIFRSYPHLDMAETGARCLAPLEHILTGPRPAKAFRRAPYLIPLHAQCTETEPMAGLYAHASALGVELASGFTAGDTPHTGPACVAYGPDAATRAETVIAALLSAETALNQPLPDARTAVRQAMALPEGRPVVLADVEDNAGGGGSSDTTGLLRALVAEGAQGAILGLMHDARAAKAAHEAGIGADIALALGGRSGCAGDAPYDGRFRVEALSEGAVRYEGEMYGGGIGQVGLSAALRVLGTEADIRVAVSTHRSQCLDRAYFHHVGLKTETARLICVKSTVHFRADFCPIAQTVIPVCVAGALASDLTQIPFQNLRPGTRLGPLGPAFGENNLKNLLIDG